MVLLTWHYTAITHSLYFIWSDYYICRYL